MTRTPKEACELIDRINFEISTREGTKDTAALILH